MRFPSMQLSFSENSGNLIEFDSMQQVKVVRDTMNRTMELWKDVPGDSERVLPRSQSKSFSKGK